MRIFLGVMAVAAFVTVPAPGARAADCAGYYVGDAAGDANGVSAVYGDNRGGSVPDDLPLPPTAPLVDARGDFTGVCVSTPAGGDITVRFDVASGVQKASDSTGRTFVARLTDTAWCRDISVIYRWGSGDSADVILEPDWGEICEVRPLPAVNEPYGRKAPGVTFSHAKGSTEFFVTFPRGALISDGVYFDRAISLLHTEVGPLEPPPVYRAPIDYLADY